MLSYIGCVSLKKAGFQIDAYFTSEINENAMTIASANHPEIIHLGKIENITKEIIESIMPIDLIFIASPCNELGFVNWRKTWMKGDTIKKKI